MRRSLLGLLVLGSLSCDGERGERNPPRPPAADVPRPRPPIDAAALHADRVLVRKSITYYRWTRTDPVPPGSAEPGTEHGVQHLSLLVEVRRTEAGLGRVAVGALGPLVAIPENARLAPEGTSLQWHLPDEGHNDPRMEIFGAEVRTDEPVRALLANQPTASQDVPVGATPSWVVLPAAGGLAASTRPGLGLHDAVLVILVPVRNRRGGRYLVQLLDLQAEPGGFSQNGVMAHAPSRAELDRLVRWMRDPDGMSRNRPPPVAMSPIDRN